MKKIFLTLIATVALTTATEAQTYSFSNAGASGVTGPDQTAVNAAYTGTDLDGLVTVTGSGIQEWTVPASGVYSISAAGASGGYTPNAAGGAGREITIEVSLNAGDVIEVLVGQEGGRAEFASPGWCGGGGGGTFIINQTTGNPILICGGGGGAGEGSAGWSSPVLPGVDASAYNVQSGGDGTGYGSSWSTPGIGGTAGNGGTAIDGGAGGGGYLTDGGFATYSGNIGIAYANGGLGGTNRDACSGGFTLDIAGGFGGGAGAGICSSYEANGGGGGGYSGGGGSNTRAGAGGGGGNYYTGTYISNSSNTGNGFAIIATVCTPLATTVSATDVCEGTEVILTASSTGTGTISWDNGITDGVGFVQPVGNVTYTATSTDGNDCAFMVNINVNPNPTVDGGVDIILCGNPIDTSLTATGAADTYTWSNGIMDGVQFMPNMGVTSYVVTAEYTASGCQATDTVNVYAGNPSITLAGSDELFGNDGSASLTINSGTPPFMFDWDNDGTGDNDDNNDLFNVAGGTYTVIITDASGCTATESVTIGSQLGVEELNTSQLIYPNPASDVLNIVTTGEYQYELIGALGESILKGNGQEMTKINLESFAAGMYVLKIVKGDDVNIHQFVIK